MEQVPRILTLDIERHKLKPNSTVSNSNLHPSPLPAQASPIAPQAGSSEQTDPFSSDLSEVSDQDPTNPAHPAPDSDSDSSGLSDVPSEEDDGGEYTVGRQRNRNRKQSQSTPHASTSMQDISMTDNPNQTHLPTRQAYYEGGTLG